MYNYFYERNIYLKNLQRNIRFTIPKKHQNKLKKIIERLIKESRLNVFRQKLIQNLTHFPATIQADIKEIDLETYRETMEFLNGIEDSTLIGFTVFHC